MGFLAVNAKRFEMAKERERGDKPLSPSHRDGKRLFAELCALWQQIRADDISIYPYAPRHVGPPEVLSTSSH